MENYNEVLKAQTDQLGFAGLANERYAIYLESVEAKANKLTASVELMWQKTINSDVIKFFLDLSTASIDAVTEMGGLIPVLETILGLMMALNASKIVSLFTEASGAANAFKVALIELRAVMSVVSMSMAGKGLGGALKALLSTIAANISAAGVLGLVIAAVTGVIVTWQLTVKKQNELGLEKTADAWTEAYANLDDELKTSYGILKTYGEMIEGVTQKQKGLAAIASAFVDKQGIIDQGLKATIKELRNTASTYEEYTSAVKRAAEIAGYTIDENGNLVRSTTGVGQAVVSTAEDFDILTNAQYSLFNSTKSEIDGWAQRWTSATKEVIDVTEEVSRNFDDLKTLIDDSFGQAFDSYIDKQNESAIKAAELREAIRELSEQDTLSDEQMTQLGDLQYELYNVEQDIMKTAEAYEKATQSAIINTMIQRISLMDLEGQAAETAYNLVYSQAEAWGLIGSETTHVMSKIDEALRLLSQGAIEEAQRVIAEILNIGNSALAISGDYFIRFNVDVVTNNVVSPGLIPGMEQRPSDMTKAEYLAYAAANQLPFNPPPVNAPTRESFPGFSGFSGLGKSASGGGGSSAKVKEEEKNMQALHKMVMTIIKEEQDARKDALKAEQDALKDQLDAYKDIIDAKKDILNAEKESLDYQDELADQTKNIAKIQNEMAILALDTSAESKARQLELAEELAEAQDELAKTQRDRSYDLQEQALEEEYALYEANINEQVATIEKAIESIDEYLSKSGQIAQDALDRIGEGAPELYQSLIDWNAEYGSGIQNDVVEAWNDAYDALLKYGNLIDALNGGEGGEIVSPVLPTHHSGISSGAVGGARTLPGEILSKLLMGEEVLNGDDILGIFRMIPKVARTMNSESSNGGLFIDKLINVEGNLAKDAVADLNKIVDKTIEKLNNTILKRGNLRSISSIY